MLLQRFYRYHELLNQKEVNKRQLQCSSSKGASVPHWKVFKQCALQCFNIFFTFFVTLSVFPSVHSDIKASDDNFVVPQIYYVDVMCFLTFNITAMLGSGLASIVQWVNILYFAGVFCLIKHLILCFTAKQEIHIFPNRLACSVHTAVLAVQLSTYRR